MSIAIEKPSGEKECSALVALSKRLGSGYTEGNDGGSNNWIVNVRDRFERPLYPVKVIWLVEPFVLDTYSSVDCDGQG